MIKNYLKRDYQDKEYSKSKYKKDIESSKVIVDEKYEWGGDGYYYRKI